ncbi:hypothetical protein ONZ45_g726 [Pleurotus djamor]|nr:hypothetical protein ONZ45_g726 [Pleurotus djamor]
MARLSLSQQIALLDDTIPVDYDPEDVQHGLDPEDALEKLDATNNSAAREHYIDVGPSSLRKLHHSVSDPKYDGVKTSRQQLYDDSDDAPSTDESDVDEDAELGDDVDHEVPSSKTDEPPFDHTDTQNNLSRPTSPKPIENDNADMTSVLQQTRDNDRRKGKAIRQQLALWDSLLDSRIKLQKAVVSSNQLPTPSVIQPAISSDDQLRSSLNDLLEQAVLLSDELSQLQIDLLHANTDTIVPPRKRRRTDLVIESSNFDEWLEEASQDAVVLENAVHPYQLQTLSKWSSKIQAVAPSVLLPSTRNAFSKNRQNIKSVVQLIDDTLTTDREKLLNRTQTRRTKGARLGPTLSIPSGHTGKGSLEVVEDGDAIDTELFDDTDFYQQLLRDIIDSRGNTSATEDWLTIQKQKKAKKKVDTKASKGRKLRYEVHEKMQNFMVPVPVPGSWHDEQMDELFASLLGKGFSHHDASGPIDVDVDEEAGQQLQEQADASLKGGFKVFG